MGIQITEQGDWKSTEDWLRRMLRGDMFRTLGKFGQMGVTALAAATPVDSGVTAASWSYDMQLSATSFKMTWTNSHQVAGKPLVIMLQYGHGTNNGGYVQGHDYINPAIRPIFDQIEAEVRRVVMQ